MDISLSIIIVSYNSLDLTLQTLQSYRQAINADRRYSYELIVVDNASQYGVADAIAESFPEIQLIRLPQNEGFSKGNNIGFESSWGRFILFSNPDIEVTEKTLPTLIRRMDQQPSVGACSPFLKLISTGQIDWGAHRGFPTPWSAFTYFTGLEAAFRWSKCLSGIFGRYHLTHCDMSVEHEVDVIRGGFFLVRRDVFEKAGKWDESYFMFGEDIDLCYQIKKLGYKIIFCPQAVALHYHGATTGLKRNSQTTSPVEFEARQRAYHAFYDSMKLFYDKNYKTQYGRIIRRLVFWGIDCKRYLGHRSRTV